MFGWLLFALLAGLCLFLWKDVVKYGTRSLGDIEFVDNHPRLGPREKLLAHFTRQTRWWTLGIVVGAAVGALLWPLVGVESAAGALTAWGALTGGLSAKLASSIAGSRPADQPAPILIPTSWTVLLVLAGVAALVMPVGMWATSQPARHLTATLIVSGVALAIIVAAHVAQRWVRTRDFAPFASEGWNHSLRTLFVAHMLLVATIAGFAACLLGSYVAPQLPGFANTKPAVLLCVVALIAPVIFLIVIAATARRLRLAIHATSRGDA